MKKIKVGNKNAVFCVYARSNQLFINIYTCMYIRVCVYVQKVIQIFSFYVASLSCNCCCCCFFYCNYYNFTTTTTMTMIIILNYFIPYNIVYM